MVWNIDPVLIHLGPIAIHYYGICFALGLLGAFTVIQKLVREKGLSENKFEELAIYLIAGVIIGARFGHIAFYELDYYWANPLQIFAVWKGGLARHGAAIGLLLSYALFLWRNPKLRFFDYADLVVVGACIPISLIRLGNFFNSELVGRTTELPWGVIFERVDTLTRHPSQLYEFAYGALLFLILYPLWWSMHKKVHAGFFFGLFFTLYFIMRFSVEFVKDFPLHVNFFSLTTGQILSLPFFILGVGVLSRSIVQNKKTPRKGVS